MLELCQKRARDSTKCELPDAHYGVTLNTNVTRAPFYTIKVCKMHFDRYLYDPELFKEEHEEGTLNLLLGMKDE